MPRFIDYAIAVAAVSAPTSLFADGATKAQANALYREGLAHHRAGRFAAAAEAFRSSYDAQAHYKTLYNLGRSYAALDRPAKAASALEQFLQEGGRAIDSARREDANRLLAAQLALLGTLEVTTTPFAATLLIDGALRPTGVIRLRAGQHEVAASLDGFETSTETVTITAQQRSRVVLELEPTPPPKAPHGAVAVACVLSDVDVRANGQSHGQTPLTTPIELPLGAQRITFVRSGFETTTAMTTVVHTGTVTVDCDLRPLTKIPMASAGTLEVVPSESGADMTYNGWPVPKSGIIPIGAHMVAVRRQGFAPWRQRVVVTAGRTTRIHATLVPTRTFRDDYEQTAHAYRVATYTLGILGIATGIGASTIAIYNERRFDDWQSEQALLASEFATLPTGATADALRARQSDNDALGEDIGTVDDVAIGLGVVSGALVSMAVLTWVLGDDPERYVTVSVCPSRIVLRANW